MKKIQLKHFQHLLILSPIIWLFTGNLAVHNGDKKLVVFVLVSIFTSLFVYGVRPLKENIKSKYIIVVCLSTLYMCTSHWLLSGSSSEVRALITCSLFFLFLPKNIVKKELIDSLLMLSSIISFSFVMYNLTILGLTRGVPGTGGGFNPIPYASALSIIGLYTLFRSFETHSHRLFFSFILLTSSIVITQTRGVIAPYLILSVCMIVFFIAQRKLPPKLILMSTAGIISFAVVFSPMIIKRINTTLHELEAIQQGARTTSIGYRLQFWEVAMIMYKEKPWFGYGEQHEQRLNELYHEGKTTKAVYKYSPTSYHNQYLDKMAKNGTVGLILLLLLQFAPLLFCGFYQLSNANRLLFISITLLFIGISIAATPFRQPLAFLPILFLSYYILLNYSDSEDPLKRFRQEE